MDVRRCSRCHEVKPVTEFYRDLQKKSGLRYECKKCSNESAKKYIIKWKERKKAQKERSEKRKLELNKFPVGGWVIRILNHCKKGEFKYSAINTNGKSLITNNREKFFNYLTKEC